MKGRPIDQLVYEYMFPKPKPTDPQNFQALLQRSLVLEVRQEVHAFYGHIDTPEAKYPGLDYCHPIHRVRLSRWTWHRRLFRAFDNLGLTPSEIASLTKWEGTKWAKERYEKEQGISIKDTTDEGIPDWVDPEVRPRLSPRQVLRAEAVDDDVAADENPDEDMEAEDDSDGEVESIGVALNERLRERAARREAGDTSAVLDEAWEQWLKTAIESGELSFYVEHFFRSSSDPSPVPQGLFPPRMLSAARAGQWHEIPDFLHDILRRAMEAEVPAAREETRGTQTTDASSTRSSTPASTTRRPLHDDIHRELVSWRRNYSDLRLPVGDAASELRVPRTADAPGA